MAERTNGLIALGLGGGVSPPADLVREHRDPSFKMLAAPLRNLAFDRP